ncbi:hypothetical protein HPB51_028552 [Rhipicephalus microplus]|uniref:Uncharacterized protein n=1 Tax=Rhipicephalus microplus TaxID=6941 RepID=A0A9J6CX88_RHIMP|nr:hypothetical protein HPB51_028552 [Rhipicephalus microplus]
MLRHSTPGRQRGRLPQLLAPLPFDAGSSTASLRAWACWAWPGAATMESELVMRVSIPVVFVNRRDLNVIVAVLGVAILGCACVLGYSFSNIIMMKRNAEEVRSYIACRTNSADPFGGSNPSTDHIRRSDAHKDTIKAPFPNIRQDWKFDPDAIKAAFPDIWRGQESDKDAIKPPFLDIQRG